MTSQVNRWYVSREEVKRSAIFRLSGVDREDERVEAAIRAASGMVEAALDTWFYPVIETRYYDHPDRSPAILELDQWLLSVTTFTTSNTTETLTSDDYFLAHTYLDRQYRPPYRCILCNPNGDFPQLSWSTTKLQANKLIGVWGYSDYVVTTGTTLSEALDTSETDWEVSDAGKIEVGNMLLVDTEQVFVSARDVGLNSITVARGQGGTTAATHLTAASISRYAPPMNIEALCGMMAARLFQRGTTGWSDIVGTRETAQQFVKSIAPEAASILQHYADDTWLGSSRFVEWGI